MHLLELLDLVNNNKLFSLRRHVPQIYMSNTRVIFNVAARRLSTNSSGDGMNTTAQTHPNREDIHDKLMPKKNVLHPY